MQDRSQSHGPDETPRDFDGDTPEPGHGPETPGPRQGEVHDAPDGPEVSSRGQERGEPVRSVPLQRRPDADTDSRGPGARDQRWFWPLVSFVGVILVIVVNGLANWLPLNDQTTGAISDAHPVYFRPAGWTFSIWSLIYALLLIVVVYGLLPMGQRDRRVQAIAPFFLIANIANISWLFAWHWERFALSQIAIVVLLGVLAMIYAQIRRHSTQEMSRFRTLLVKTPFSIYLGWISIATLANLQTWMDADGWTGGLFGLRGWAVVFLFAGILVAAGFAFFLRDAAYPLVFAWGYAGIAAEQWDPSRVVGVIAGILAVVAIVVAAMGALLSYDTRSGIRPLPKPLRRNRNTTETVDA